MARRWQSRAHRNWRTGVPGVLIARRSGPGNYGRVTQAGGIDRWWVRSSNRDWIALSHQRVVENNDGSIRTEASLKDAPCVNDLVEMDVCEVRFYIVEVRHQCSLKYPHNGQPHGCRCGEMSRLLVNVGSE